VATKREKKDKAKALIPTIPIPIRRLTPAGRLYDTAATLAKLLIESDPLRIISDDPVEQMVNDPNFKMTPELMELINDDSIIMSNGSLQSAGEVPSGLDVIRRSGQFDLQNLLPRNVQPEKRTRKKTKTDKNMSKALRMANERFRTKKGKLRKGASQAPIMKFAHKLLKKM